MNDEMGELVIAKLRYYPRRCLKGLGKPSEICQESQCPGQDFNQLP